MAPSKFLGDESEEQAGAQGQATGVREIVLAAQARDLERVRGEGRAERSGEGLQVLAEGHRQRGIKFFCCMLLSREAGAGLGL